MDRKSPKSERPVRPECVFPHAAQLLYCCCCWTKPAGRKSRTNPASTDFDSSRARSVSPVKSDFSSFGVLSSSSVRVLPESTDLFGSRVIRSGTPGEKGVSLVNTRAFLRHGLAPGGFREVGFRVQAKEVKARKLWVSLSGVRDVFRCYTWLRLPSLAAAAAVGWEMKIKRRRKRQRSSIP
ncbi:hypothetical protein RP20_CCG016184 [Aedes albopictus]|nr:hypothetical protein RP20_CCG016184 [Aedes albopictus]